MFKYVHIDGVGEPGTKQPWIQHATYPVDFELTRWMVLGLKSFAKTDHPAIFEEQQV